jgi:hypothetical protein
MFFCGPIFARASNYYLLVGLIFCGARAAMPKINVMETGAEDPDFSKICKKSREIYRFMNLRFTDLRFIVQVQHMSFNYKLGYKATYKS